MRPGKHVCALSALITIACAAARDVHAQNPPAGGSTVQVRGAIEPGSIRGMVFDSLAMRAVPFASVTLVGVPKPVVADRFGKFKFDDVAAGVRTVIFNAPDLDSLGFGAMGAQFTLQSKQQVEITLATPSLRTVWERRCQGALPMSSDSGIVWGTVRNAETLSPAEGVEAGFHWYDLNAGTVPGLMINDVRKQVATAKDGLFFACGVPTGVALTSAAIDSTAASGVVEYALGERRMMRLDLLVSGDMIMPDTLNLHSIRDSTAALRARGLATVSGIITDERNRPIADAVVSIPGTDTTVRSNKQGKFVLAGMPGGTHSLDVRRVGFAKQMQMVSLRPGEVTNVAMTVSGMNVLSAYNVRAKTGKKGSDLLAFEKRRQLGTGMFLEGRAITSRHELEDALRVFPGVILHYNRTGRYGLSMDDAVGGRCVPRVWLDGLPSSMNIVAMRKPEDFRAIEVYNRVSEVPREYQQEMKFICGVMLFWSRNARW